MKVYKQYGPSAVDSCCKTFAPALAPARSGPGTSLVMSLDVLLSYHAPGSAAWAVSPSGSSAWKLICLPKFRCLTLC